MGEQASTGEERSFLRFFLWEGLGLVGLLSQLSHPLADKTWSMVFFDNAVFFLAAYPVMYLGRWKLTDGCLGMVFWPVGFVLSWALGVSAFLWTAYVLYRTGSPYYFSLVQHFALFGFLFIFIYFPLIQPLWGISKRYHTLGHLFWFLLYSGLGGFLGFLLGRFVDEKFGGNIGTDSRRFLVWLALILLGMAIGSMAAGKRGK